MVMAFYLMSFAVFIYELVRFSNFLSFVRVFSIFSLWL